MGQCSASCGNGTQHKTISYTAKSSGRCNNLHPVLDTDYAYCNTDNCQLDLDKENAKTFEVD